jgi:hypothetical protein
LRLFVFFASSFLISSYFRIRVHDSFHTSVLLAEAFVLTPSRSSWVKFLLHWTKKTWKEARGSGFQFLVTKENALSYRIPQLYFLYPKHYGADFVKRSKENLGTCSPQPHTHNGIHPSVTINIFKLYLSVLKLINITLYLSVRD